MPSVATGVGAAVGLYGARKQAKAAQSAADAQRQAAEMQYKASLPVGVTGMFGDVAFDEDTREMKITGDPRLQAEYDIALQDPAKQRAFRAELEADPYAAGQKFYEMQKELYAPQQEKERLALEERLLAQGMLGSTGGAERQQALLEAQAQQDRQAQYEGLEKAQSLIDLYRGRELEGIGTAETIGALPFKYAQLSRGIGSDLGSAAATAAKMKGQAASALSQSKSNLYGSYANIAKGLFDGVSTPGGSGSGFFDFSGDTYGGYNFDSTKLGDNATSYDFYAPWN